MIKTNISKKIGKSSLTFQVEGEDEVSTLLKASGFTSMPDVCGLCSSEEVFLNGTKAKGFTYIKIVCLNPKCGATSTLGQYRDGDGVFWKNFEIYTKEGGES